ESQGTWFVPLRRHGMAGTSGDGQLAKAPAAVVRGDKPMAVHAKPIALESGNRCARQQRIQEHASAEYDIPEPRLLADPGTDGGDDLDEGRVEPPGDEPGRNPLLRLVGNRPDQGPGVDDQRCFRRLAV